MKTKKIIIAAVLASLMSGSAYAQSAVDAISINPTELRGTARFVSMGGAFTSVGGDLSTMTQNPAGIGIYRRSDVGLTFDISARNYTTESPGDRMKQSETKAYFDNFGYVGSIKLNGAMRNFSWGVSYNRLNSFDRITDGYNASTQTSLSNYIASFTNGIDSDELGIDDSYNPYLDSDRDWLSILGYNSYMINNIGGYKTMYQGLMNENTNGDALYRVIERGYIDEYNIAFGGNISDMIFWGVDVGINDLKYQRQAYYSESMENASVSRADNSITVGNAGIDMDNYKSISGTGFNFKFGLIFRPIDELRIGAAIHTPTYYTLNHIGDATLNYSYLDTSVQNGNILDGSEYTDVFDYDSRINGPWRFMVGASAYLGQRGLISVDYERVAYSDMTVKYYDYGRYGGGSYVTDEFVKQNIKDYFQAANIIRIGAEFRITPTFSLRAGYNFQTSNVRDEAKNGNFEIATAGTDPSYSFDKTTQGLSVGLGYRYKSWYIDAAYQYKNKKSTFHAYTDFGGFEAPKADVTDNIHNVVISTGFRF